MIYLSPRWGLQVICYIIAMIFDRFLCEAIKVNVKVKIKGDAV